MPPCSVMGYQWHAYPLVSVPRNRDLRMGGTAVQF